LAKCGWFSGLAAAGAARNTEAEVDEFRSWASDDEGLFSIVQASFLPLAGFQGNECVLELYYNSVVTPYLSISPDIQHIEDPGSERGGEDSLVLGLHAQVLPE
jgi:hypothetical protein